mgnify:FL=1
MHLFDRPTAPNPYEALPPTQTFTLKSNDLIDGQSLPLLHSAQGGNVSPHLQWSEFPQETESFFVSCFDPDAPTPSGFWHWMIIDLPSSCTSLAQGVGHSDLELDGSAFHLRGDHGDHSYFGAAPPAGDRPHRYIFSVHALDIPTLGCDDDTSLAMYSFEAIEHTIARATLTATYQTPSN